MRGLSTCFSTMRTGCLIVCYHHNVLIYPLHYKKYVHVIPGDSYIAPLLITNSNFWRSNLGF